MQIESRSWREQTKRKNWNDAKITGEWGQEKSRNMARKKGRGEMVKISLGSSRPSYGDERWGAEEKSINTLHYMVFKALGEVPWICGWIYWTYSWVSCVGCPDHHQNNSR